MRALMLIATVVAVAGCGQNEASAPASGDATPAPPAKVAPARTEAETAAILASLPTPYNAADLENGRRAFARCRSCHTITPGGANMTGPNLHGVFGRAAGGLEGYNYSTALKAAGFTWDGARLDQWLAGPRTFLPGNKMSFPGLPDPTDRRDLIAYLQVETNPAPATATPAA